MKKLLSLLLALAMTMSLAACGDKKDAEDANTETKQEEKVEKKEDKKEEVDGEEAATEAMEGFLDAICDLDFEAAEKFYDGEIPAELKSSLGDLDTLVEEAMKEMPAEFGDYKKDFEDVLNVIVDKAKESISYEIKNVDGEGEEYKFTVEMAYPDENFDGEKAFTDAFGDVEEKTMELVTKLAEEGKITETSTEEDLMKAIIPELINLLKDAVKDVKIDTVTEEAEFTVVLKDGEWLVSEK